MADARDILGLGAASAGAGAPRPRAQKQMIQKPAGMSREVFALLVQDAAAGKETAVPLVPTAPSTDVFKERKTRVTGWEHRKFTNAAREDDGEASAKRARSGSIGAGHRRAQGEGRSSTIRAPRGSFIARKGIRHCWYLGAVGDREADASRHSWPIVDTMGLGPEKTRIG